MMILIFQIEHEKFVSEDSFCISVRKKKLLVSVVENILNFIFF